MMHVELKSVNYSIVFEKLAKYSDKIFLVSSIQIPMLVICNNKNVLLNADIC